MMAAKECFWYEMKTDPGTWNDLHGVSQALERFQCLGTPWGCGVGVLEVSLYT